MNARSPYRANPGESMEIPQEEWFKVKDTTKRLELHVFGNGKPPLEARMREYVDERDSHKERNAQQDIVDLRTDIDKRHVENTTTFKEFKLYFESYVNRQADVNRLVYIGMGIMIALEAVGLFKGK